MNYEHLVQRIVDQELSAEERIQFVVALGRDEALRDRVVELERLVLGASRLARPAVPESFLVNVLRETMPSVRPVTANRRRLIDRLLLPRAFHWNLAGAAAVACLILLAVGAGVAQALRWRTASVVASSSNPGSLPVVLVRLVVVQPGARVVQAAGDFNGWNPSQTPLEPTADGAWTVTLPLQPGRYEYQFVVDGEQWIGDPFAAEQSNDGFGSRNAVLDVRPPADGLL